MANWFEPAAMFIMFREALEAAVIVAVLLQLMNKLNMRHLKKHVWIGALGGVVISIIIGVIFIIIFYVVGSKVFSGNGELIFKGSIQWIASLMITVVAFAMLKFYNLERKWRHKLEGAARKEAEMEKNGKSHKWSIILLAGSATLREGIESVLFLTGVSGGNGVRAIIIPGIVGIILGLLVGVLIFYSGKPIKSLKWFFFLCCFLLLLISSGLVVSGLYNFIQAGLFGAIYPYEYRPWATRIMWDTSGCCSQTNNKFWQIINALFGYQDQPTNIMLLYYCLYWAVVLVLLVWKWRHGTLTDERLAAMPSVRAASSSKLSAKFSGSDDLESGSGSADMPPSPSSKEGFEAAPTAPPVGPPGNGDSIAAEGGSQQPASPKGAADSDKDSAEALAAKV